jgi:hypothetical protein
MALPPPPAAALAVITNPIESFLTGFNTNTYFIGLMMILLNLGGRHFPTALTPEQDKVFQLIWVRRIFLFVIIFVATRNIFTAVWLCLALTLVLGYLTNETSSLYLFGEGKPSAAPPPPPAAPSELSPEEQDIFKKLNEKVAKIQAQKKEPASKEEPDAYVSTYMNSMRYIQSNI